jgi:hypothetical protein
MSGAFTLETTVAGPARRSSIGDAAIVPQDAQAVLYEVIDGRTERDEIERPWEIRETFPKLPHNPVAAGWMLFSVRQ